MSSDQTKTHHFFLLFLDVLIKKKPKLRTYHLVCFFLLFFNRYVPSCENLFKKEKLPLQAISLRKKALNYTNKYDVSNTKHLTCASNPIFFVKNKTKKVISLWRTPFLMLIINNMHV